MNSTSNNNFDSDFCGSIPLNFINLIQPRGMLILLDKTYQVVQVSENISDFLGKELQEIVGQAFETLITEGQFALFQQKIERRKVHQRIPLMLHFKSARESLRFTGVVHFYDAYFILELEPNHEESADITFIRAYQDIKYITAALQQAQDLENFGSIAAHEIKTFSGFDRVMMYHFDSEWNGTVIAEAKTEGLEPYLYLKFPASDVPKQARALYLSTPYRLITDVNAQPVRLFPIINPIVKGFTDISHCTLRSVPQVHIEYLNNMRVQASMSTAIIVDGKLWGLISCHHSTPKYIPFELRYAFEMLAELIALQLASRKREARVTQLKGMRSQELKLMELIYREKEFPYQTLLESDHLLHLFRAGGVALMWEENYKTSGNVPSKSQTKELMKWLRLFNRDKIFISSSLIQHFSSAKAYADIGSGLLAIQFSHAPTGYLLIFRPEIVHTVNWGGNPNETIQFELDGKKYHPRNSFKEWKEQVENSALPWESELVEIAKDLRTVLLEKILMEMQ